MSAPLLVTGASGTVGRRVVATLAEQGLPVRAAARRPLEVVDAEVEPVVFDFTMPSTFGPAFTGVQAMLLVRPPALGRLSDLLPALQAAVQAQVRHVVFLSVQGAEKLPVLPHARVERWLASSGLSWTFLRPSFFNQNLVTVHGPAIRQLDELVMPAGSGRTAFVDAADVAAVAALVLADPSHHQQRDYTLTGAEALTYHDVADILSDVTGRQIRYRQPGLLRYLYRAGFELGLPAAMVAATAVVYTSARLGLAAGLSPDMPRLLGRPATTVAAFAEREKAAFLKPPLPDPSEVRSGRRHVADG